MTWNADTLAAFLLESTSFKDLVAALDDLTEADRSAIRKRSARPSPPCVDVWGRTAGADT